MIENKVPSHLQHRVSQEAWDYTNEMAQIISVLSREDIKMWMVRNWFISYLCNPDMGNRRDLIYCLRMYTSVTKFGLIEILYDLKSFLKVDKNTVIQEGYLS
jgi:hypothetical protein